ncbi:transport protein particle component, partial [Piptocephalis cylindrospora]
RLEGLGYRVGTALAERYTKGRPYMTENLDVIKFICKDFWIAVFRRQVDNLRTNHRGVYVLQDNTFRWLSRASTGLGGADAARRSQPFLWFPCGIIRGALANLGVAATVTAETTGLPQCTFHIKIHK